MIDPNLTDEQRQAVTDGGGSLLVSAAAGSGKTKVLVERLFRRVEEEHCSVDDFLIITYTRAAAAELRGKIARELSQRVAQQPENVHLRRQLFRVYQADIKTVDAFCGSLLREHIHLLPPVNGRSLTPDYRLLDEQEGAALRSRVLDRVMDRFYEALEQGDENAALLAQTLGAGRDDSRLTELVLELYEKLQSQAHPLQWLQETRKFWQSVPNTLTDTPFGELLLADLGQWAEFWSRRLRRAQGEMSECPKVEAAYGSAFAAMADAAERLRRAAATGWDAAGKTDLSFPSLKAVRGAENEEVKSRMKALKERFGKELKEVMEPFSTSQAEHLMDLHVMAPAMLALLDLTAEFIRALQQEKVRRNVADFSDQEHYAVELLLTADGSPTELARQIAESYVEIMVDEYQDTNEVQNAIFQAVSGGGRKLFLVGDVKQSIYRFRLADPTIFLGKYRAFRPHTEAAEGEPRRIILGRNFRSRATVLEGANYVFRSIMSTEFGEMDYTADEALYPGAPFPPDGRYAVELDAVDASAEGEEEKTARDLIEARFAAKRIRTLVDGGFPVSDGEGGERPVRPADIVILLRSPNTVLHHYARALGERDIPWEAEGGGDFFAATEVNVALSLLQIVDNPRQDVPLISVLRSPVYGFSADRLAELRAASPDTDFYAALTADGGEDSRAFLTELDELRFGAGELSSHELLWQLYDRTNLLGVFGAMERGEERQSNLLTLAELARRFEGAGHKGLFGFLSYLTRLRENGAKLALPAPGREGGGVRILSIHKSKGLEFPVVFLCGVNRGLIPYESERRTADRAEERRLFYVGMTRARDELILLAGEEPSEFLADIPPARLELGEAHRRRERPAEQLSLF